MAASHQGAAHVEGFNMYMLRSEVILCSSLSHQPSWPPVSCLTSPHRMLYDIISCSVTASDVMCLFGFLLYVMSGLGEFLENVC